MEAFGEWGVRFIRKQIVAFSSIGLLALAACSTPKAENNSVTIETFDSLQKQYFPKLDLRANAEQVRTIPGFAAKLSAVADEQRAKLSAGQLTEKIDREKAGLIFIYDALLTHNNTLAALDGKLALKDLVAARRFTQASGSDGQELKARADYVVEELTSAASLRPGDRRIDSWLAGAKSNVERVRDGTVSDKTLEAALDAIPVRPTFNLWTALLMFHERDVSSPLYERLSSESQRFVDRTSAGDDPCKARPQDCGNGPNAPYNFQGAITTLGDLFLRRAEYFLQKGDIPNAMQMAGYAKGTYAQLDRPDKIQGTGTWPDRTALSIRKDRLAKIHMRQQPDGDFVSTDAYKRVYECASCHGRVGN